jgi:uncharacterized membrane protein
MLHEFFSHFCGQPADRCFAIGGHLLPVCQRCLGVYVGLLFGVTALLAASRRRIVVPSRAESVLIVVAIVAMVVMGLHLIDPGPFFRYWGGYAFGVAMAMLGFAAAGRLITGGNSGIRSRMESLCLMSVLVLAAGVVQAGLMLEWHPLLAVFSILSFGGWLVALGLSTLALGSLLAAGLQVCRRQEKPLR